MIGVTRRAAIKELALGVGLGLMPRWAFAQESAPPQASAFDLGLQAQDLLARGDADQARQAVRALLRAIEMEPDNGWLWGLLGRARMLTGERELAREAFLRASALDAGDALSRAMARRLDPGQAGNGIPGDLDMAELERQARLEREELAESGRGLDSAHGPGQEFRVARVVLDPGHGGFDPGAVGPTGLKEKDVTLDIARRAESLLQEAAPHVAVFLTRDQDVFLPLSSRTAAANQFGADLFVSLHVNAAERRAANGVETYFCSETASSREAERVARAENAALDLEDAVSPGPVSIEEIMFRFERRRYWEAGSRAAARAQATLAPRLAGLDDRGVHCADFYVLRKARMPAVLLETGFISNPAEERRLWGQTRRQEMALAVAGTVAALAREDV